MLVRAFLYNEATCKKNFSQTFNVKMARWGTSTDKDLQANMSKEELEEEFRDFFMDLVTKSKSVRGIHEKLNELKVNFSESQLKTVDEKRKNILDCGYAEDKEDRETKTQKPEPSPAFPVGDEDWG